MSYIISYAKKKKKVLYGLKQSPLTWFGSFTEVMIFISWAKLGAIHPVLKHLNIVAVMTLLRYVDNIIITGNDKQEKRDSEARFNKKFEIKQLEELKHFLGFELCYSHQVIHDKSMPLFYLKIHRNGL